MPNEKILELFNQKLNIQTKDPELQKKFYKSIIAFLDHGHKEGIINGRTYAYVSEKLDELMKILQSIGLNETEIVKVLSNTPSLLNSPETFYQKYLLLGIIENEDNTFRLNKLLNKTNDFRIGLQSIFARYTLATNLDYPKINWNLLVHSSSEEFAKIFTINNENGYYKPYRIFETEEDVKAYLAKISLDDLDIESIKEWDVNKRIVEQYEKSIGRN